MQGFDLKDFSLFLSKQHFTIIIMLKIQRVFDLLIEKFA